LKIQGIIEMAINELRAIDTFSKAVAFGSIRQAATALGVTPQAASQTIAQLELHLGVRLLHRTTRSLALTDEGQRFLEATQPALGMLDRALSQIRESKDEIAGPLRIVGPRTSFAEVLMPVIDEFCTRYPSIQPDIQLDDGIGNWVEDRVDVGFRIGVSPQDGLISRKLFPIQLLICASPDYIRKFGKPRTIDDLSKHRCSSFRHPATGQVLPWYFSIDHEIIQRHVPPNLSTNDADLELQAVLAGQVIGQVSNMAAARYIRSNDLRVILKKHTTSHLGLHIYYGNRTAQPKRVRAFIDHAIQKLADTKKYILSEKEM
jgi:DNA-binding transcriptional LysR family regulator